MRSIKELDVELEKRKQLVTKFQAERVALGKRLETLRSKREALSLAAHSGEDTEARKKLQAAHDEQRKTELELEDLLSAIAGANREIETLREQRAETQRREQQAKYESGQADLMTAAAEFELKLAAFIEQKGIIEKQFTELNRLSFGLYASDEMPHRNLPRASRWALEQRLVLDTPYRDHGFRERFKKPIHEIFNRIMNHAATDDDETENKEDGKQQVNDEKQPSAKKKASGE
jgi:hypothetical protein